jgi:hypothetical protein
MRLKYLILVLVTLLMAITGCNAANNYSILVGTHEVSFNASLSFIENLKITYSPVMPGDFGLDYTHSATSLGNDTKSFLTVTVRDFKSPISENAFVLEKDTLEELMDHYLPLGNVISMHYISNPMVNGGAVSGIVRDHENEYFGALMAWPSDQIEIIITGSLPSKELWLDISKSMELVR